MKYGTYMVPLFMIQDKTVNYEGAERVSMEPKKEKKLPEYKADKVELSKTIQAFDRKKVITKNPFDYNTISLKQTNELTKSASDLITDPIYNQVGKMFGIDMAHDWNKYYDKVYEVVKIAKENGIKEENISSWIYKQINSAPDVSGNRINDTYIYLKMSKPKTEKPKVKVITKYIKPKDDSKQFVNKWLKGVLNGSAQWR